jgi:hypothetical protein
MLRAGQPTCVGVDPIEDGADVAAVQVHGPGVTEEQRVAGHLVPGGKQRV